jgi:hypothetical protein
MAGTDHPAEVVHHPDDRDRGLRSGDRGTFDAAGLLLFAGGSLLIGWVETESRRSRREREALVARLAELPPADVPADVVTLV